MFSVIPHFIEIVQVVWTLFTCGQLDGHDEHNNIVLEYIFLSAFRKDKGCGNSDVRSFKRTDSLKYEARKVM
jgi:hypothetical protein